jgi:serine/threonine protein phosphatase 1
MKLFVLSDVHSFYEPMMTALEKNGFDINNPDHHIVVCGDLFDRGPDANKVFTFAKRMADEGRFNYVCGNHEDLLFDCVREIHERRGVSSHHVSNGTLDTLIQITGFNKYDLYGCTCDPSEFAQKVNPFLNFIADNTVDWVEVGDYIFVHGWIPCNPYNGKVDENWRDGDWDEARWINGMSAWHKGARLENKPLSVVIFTLLGVIPISIKTVRSSHRKTALIGKSLLNLLLTRELSQLMLALLIRDFAIVLL